MSKLETAKIMLTKASEKLPLLSSIPEFIGKLPATLKIPANKESIIISNGLENSTISVGAGSNTIFIALLSKGWEELKKLNFNFADSDASLTFFAFVIGSKEEKFSFETISTHTAQKTNAYYHVRAALFDKSQIDYTGNLIIKKTAQITNSYLSHHTLMLSKNAKTRTIPCLEIEADDVKAGHAATIGNVDEEMLFYLGSRGLDKKAAQSLLIKSFLESNLKEIPNEKIQQILSKEIEKSLP